MQLEFPRLRIASVFPTVQCRCFDVLLYAGNRTLSTIRRSRGVVSTFHDVHRRWMVQEEIFVFPGDFRIDLARLGIVYEGMTFLLLFVFMFRKIIV